MKDIKQYFANGKNIVDKETDTDLGNVKKDQEQEDIATNKHKCVRIQISSNGSSSKMCDIENKKDLIDKTPSPFNGEINNGERTLQDETPKSGLTESGIKRRLKKHSKFTVEINRNQSEVTRNISQEQKLNNQIVMNLNGSLNDNVNSEDETKSNIELCDEIGSQRKESNAFQVLMNHSKPIQYKSPQQSIEDSENKEKSDSKEFRSRCKEKLIALADKKGYSRKKIAEMEEGEKIEKNIENRIRFFKGESKSNTHEKDSFELSIKTNKQSGNLLDYFSKSPLGLTNKDEKCVSTFTVKADVHRTDNSDVCVEPMRKLKSNKKYPNKKCTKSELDLSTMDDIHVVESENLLSLQPVKQDKQKREKPRWSLRIKLHSSEDNDSLYDTDDELFSPRSKSKFSASSKSGKSVNIDNNEVCTKNHNRHLKMKERNKERKELIVKDSNISNIVKDAPNGNTDFKKSNSANKKEQKINEISETVIIIDDSEYMISNENILKRKPNEKLAPLFIKRHKIDPAVTAARRLFLQSDIIDVENKNTDHKVNNGIPVLPFPAISHITQLEDESDSIRSEIEHKFSMKIEKQYLPSIDIINYKYITNCREASKMIKTIKGPVKENVEQVLSEIKKLYPDVRRMWETISTIKGDLEKKSPSPEDRKTRAHERKRMLTENIETEEKQSHNCAWTYKYKPMSAQEIVGNEEGASKLKDWLSGWRTSLTKEDDDSSGDEFYSSDCSSSFNIENNQIAVLLGPHGSGKSASVYAIAEELGYSVIEVNASSKRTGKRILKELEEATKSHRIKKSKHKSPFERITNDDETSKISQNSLILLEDIDLIFEEDEGFVSAAYQLASNTKRPIVMTCRNTCPHLNKMAPQQNKVYFHKVSGNTVSTLLELIALAETGYRIPPNCLRKLLQEGDLRQALLQLQYLLLSGLPVLSQQSMIAKSLLWQDMQRYLYKPAIKLNKRHKTKKTTNTKNSNDTYILNNLAEDLDSLSLMSSLIDVEDTTLDMSEEKMQPNLSLAENMSFYSTLHDLNADIADFINSQILYKNFDANEHVQKNQSNIILRKQLKQGVDLALSHVTSMCLDRRIMALDYLPTARTICRAEESRSSINYKRGNRFFHYLHSLKVPSASMKPNILAAACKMLQEGGNKTASVQKTITID
ncbi:PREDICTED: replication factor C subunit 1 [Trachymyrmex cornetzi]|uniref:ATPase family AAA domain-containing protein 5 n=1 Tax=Trachymyrmex cornetzi TaxID=471704 RepID=A0A195DB15_9HYME|nr:PREDICTED: replication factor C subunit 1 [Trachymyrmex cornetzi]KYN10078.1 ATPase family AAA domain-containing protein 5 [Trachymyrmex cornetzi]